MAVKLPKGALLRRKAPTTEARGESSPAVVIVERAVVS
jgi:hypothetical protein